MISRFHVMREVAHNNRPQHGREVNSACNNRAYYSNGPGRLLCSGEEATIGICDAIYYRTGSYDDISAGKSSFMVELLETANI